MDNNTTKAFAVNAVVIATGLALSSSGAIPPEASTEISLTSGAVTCGYVIAKSLKKKDSEIESSDEPEENDYF